MPLPHASLPASTGGLEEAPEGRFTAGPWSIAEDDRWPALFHILGPSFKISYWTIASNISFEDARQRQRDARLIASAPDMFAALAGLKDILDRAESNASGNPEWEAVSSRINAARAALSKALGLHEGGE